MAGFLPVIESTKSSLHSWAMSLRSFPSSRDAHFCFTSGFSAWSKGGEKSGHHLSDKSNYGVRGRERGLSRQPLTHLKG